EQNSHFWISMLDAKKMDIFLNFPSKFGSSNNDHICMLESGAFHLPTIFSIGWENCSLCLLQFPPHLLEITFPLTTTCHHYSPPTCRHHPPLAIAAEVQSLLVFGRKKEALHCATEGQLWGPAFVLAAQLGDQFYVDTVKQMALRQLVTGLPLRTLCHLIYGTNVMLDDWEENLAVITANRTKDDELVLIHLGDCLWRKRSELLQWINPPDVVSKAIECGKSESEMLDGCRALSAIASIVTPLVFDRLLKSISPFGTISFVVRLDV
ncbi:hypothetical protein LOK49_LG06G00989, partial [Camellia lanceoleosa]